MSELGLKDSVVAERFFTAAAHWNDRSSFIRFNGNEGGSIRPGPQQKTRGRQGPILQEAAHCANERQEARGSARTLETTPECIDDVGALLLIHPNILVVV